METGLTFSSLFSKIVAEAHPRLVVDKELSHSSLDKVQIGLTKNSLSIADEQLNVDDVCAMFGQHVKFIVSQTLALVREDAQSASAFSTLPNAFEVLIASQKTVDKVTLPLKIQERNKKDKLLDDLVSFFESKGWDSRLSESLRVLLPHVFCVQPNEGAYQKKEVYTAVSMTGHLSFCNRICHVRARLYTKTSS